MTPQRREFLTLGGAAALFGAYSQPVPAQGTTGGPKLTQILRADLEGQVEKVQETVVSLLEMPQVPARPGTCIRGLRSCCLLSTATS
jgi:hypothetical protein